MPQTEVTVYNAKLASRIQEVVVHYFRPSLGLCYFHKYSTSVLTRRDMENINAKVITNGDSDAAVLLLERLPLYENWFNCLLLVLQDRDIKLGHVAKELERIKAELDEELDKDKDVGEYEKEISEMAENFHLSEQTTDEPEEAPFGAEKVTEADNTSENEYEVVEDEEQHQNSDEDDFEVLIPFTEPEREGSLDPRVANEGPNPEGEIPVFVQSLGVQTMVEKKTCSVAVQCGTSKAKKPKTAVHGPQYNFSAEEVAQALSVCPGWHAHMDERGIWTTLVPLMRQGKNGYYLLWFWKRKMRPAISVTKGDDVKTFVVHKRPGKSMGSETIYFIIKEAKFKTLLQTVQHHIQNGIDYENNTKQVFLAPVTPDKTAL